MTDPKPALPPEDALLILEQANLAAQAAVPLPPGLRAMAAESTSRRTRACLLEMANRLEAGESLPAVLASLQPRLTPLMSTLVEQGAEIGRLDTILYWATEQSRRTFSQRWMMWSALCYPLVLLGVGGVICMTMMFWTVPMFKHIFDDFGTQLPGLTILLISVADFIVAYWPWGILLGAVLAFVILFLPSSKWLKTRRWSWSVPVVGPLMRLETLAEFCHLLAVFIEIRLPLPKAIRLASRATDSPWLATGCEYLAFDIEHGESLHSAGDTVGLPSAVVQILHEPSTPTAISEALHGLGEIYGNQATNNSRFASVILEPFILLFIAVGLGLMTAALFMPLIKLLNDLS